MTIRTHSRRLVTGQETSQKRNTTITPEMQAAQWRPGQSGNPSGRPHKTPFTTALLRILEKKIANDPDGRALLDGIAQQLVAKASKGDLASIRELADRIEGTPAWSITLGGEGGGAIPFVNVSPARMSGASLSCSPRLAGQEIATAQIDPSKAGLFLRTQRLSLLRTGD